MMLRAKNTLTLTFGNKEGKTRKKEKKKERKEGRNEEGNKAEYTAQDTRCV